MTPQPVDVLVIGAGLGGLAAAPALAEQGARITLCEALRYLGGWACTFERKGVGWEAGATLFSGFGAGTPARTGWPCGHGPVSPH